MERRPSAARSESGFSMIELLVAFAILAMSASSLLLLGTTTAQGNTRSKEHAAAASLGVAKIEELKNQTFGDVASGADAGTIDAGGNATGLFTRSWAVTSTVVSGVPAKNVTVTVQGTPDVTVSLSTTIIDPPSISPGYFEGFPTVASRGWSQR